MAANKPIKLDITPRLRRAVRRDDAATTYYAVCRALRLPHDLEALYVLADVTYDVHDIAAATDALRDNPPGQALAMAYEVLRERHPIIPPPTARRKP